MLPTLASSHWKITQNIPYTKWVNFTHFVYGIKWVKIGDRARILQMKNPGYYPRGFLFGQTLIYYKYLPIFCRTTFG